MGILAGMMHWTEGLVLMLYDSTTKCKGKFSSCSDQHNMMGPHNKLFFPSDPIALQDIVNPTQLEITRR